MLSVGTLLTMLPLALCSQCCSTLSTGCAHSAALQAQLANLKSQLVLEDCGPVKAQVQSSTTPDRTAGMEALQARITELEKLLEASEAARSTLADLINEADDLLTESKEESNEIEQELDLVKRGRDNVKRELDKMRVELDNVRQVARLDLQKLAAAECRLNELKELIAER